MQELNLPSPFWLAPMAGYTDQAMRKVWRHFGRGLFYTEVAVAQGLIRDSAPSWHLLSCDPEEHPVAGHMYGREPAAMAEAAQRIEASGRFAVIDINCGCPVRKIVAKGAGAALIREPAQIARIVKAVQSAVSLPVYIKTRIGYETGVETIREIARRAEDAGASALAIHGRYAADHHKGPADWEMIARVKQQVQIPVIGNGGIKTAQQAVAAMQTYGVDAVMIARGAVGNPWILADAETLWAGGTPPIRAYPELRRVVHWHLRELVAYKAKENLWRRRGGIDPDRAAALQFRCHLIQYLAGLEHWADVRRNFSRITCCQQIHEMVDTVIARQSRPWQDLYPMRG
ncbi:MAG: tRNA dihydrouridine synthase [Kiritimatiellia bacterium]